MTTLSKDELFQILSNSRRRHIIFYLSEAGEPVALKRLAAKIAAAETGTPEAEITTDERQRVYISLYQTHLPKLRESGIVTYDEDARTVSLTDDIAEEGFFWMDTAEETASPWVTYYLGLTLLSWLLVLGVWLSLPLVELLGWTGVAVVSSFGLSALVVAQYLTETRQSTETDGYESLVE